MNDITNISHSLSNGNDDTPTNIETDLEEDDAMLKDDFIGGTNQYECYLTKVICYVDFEPYTYYLLVI